MTGPPWTVRYADDPDVELPAPAGASAVEVCRGLGGDGPGDVLLARGGLWSVVVAGPGGPEVAAEGSGEPPPGWIHGDYAAGDGGSLPATPSGALDPGAGGAPLNPTVTPGAIPPAPLSPADLFPPVMRAAPMRASASALNKLAECELKWAYHYLCGVDDVAGPEAADGLVIHRALAHVLKGRMAAAVESWDAGRMAPVVTEPEMWAAIAATTGEPGGEIPRLVAAVAGARLSFRYAVAAEERIEGELAGVPYLGYIDRLDELSDGSAEIVDYKTGMYVPSGAELEEAPQTLLYGAWALEQGYKRVAVVYEYVAAGKRYRFRVANSGGAEALLRKYWDAMGRISRPEDATPTVGGHCARCTHRGICPAYGAEVGGFAPKFRGARPIPSVVTPGNVSEVVAEWRSLREIEKIVEGRREELASVLLPYIQEAGETESVYLRVRSTEAYDPHEVFALLEAAGVDWRGVADLSNKKLGLVLDGMTAERAAPLREELSRLASLGQTRPWLDVRKGKSA